MTTSPNADLMNQAINREFVAWLDDYIGSLSRAATNYRRAGQPVAAEHADGQRAALETVRQRYTGVPT